MKKFFWFLYLLFSFIALNAQILDPTRWNFSVKHLKGDNYVFVAECKIEPGWHLYSTRPVEGDGPIPTSFTFEKSNQYQITGKLEESKPIVKKEPVFDNIELAFFENKAVFKQKFTVKSIGKIRFKGSVEFMLCNESQCLPPDIREFDIEFEHTGNSTVHADKNESTVDKNEGQLETNITNTDKEQQIPDKDQKNNSQGILEPYSWSINIEKISNKEFYVLVTAKLEKGWHIYSMHQETEEGPVPTSVRWKDLKNLEVVGDPEEIGNLKKEYDPNFLLNLATFDSVYTIRQKLKLTGEQGEGKLNIEFMVCDAERCLPPDEQEFYVVLPPDSKTSITNAQNFDSNQMGFWELFFLSFLGGLVVLFTPCVFPMIPLTVSFFTKQSKTKIQTIRNAVFYGISIIVIYVVLGTVVTAIFGFDSLNALSTNLWFNLFFFILLLLFGISFLGAFEITLPSSWTNKMDRMSDKGGLIGIFFMAFTLALVSFSCTGPVAGPLLVQAATVGGWGPVIGMFGFSLALALPFALFAAFPGWLQSLPKSGGWMVSIKVFLGFLEIAFALKFLSNADLVIQAGWLTRELFIALWIAIFGTLALYLFGFIRLPHDEKVEKLSVGRAMLATLVLAFVIYLIPGLWGAPLKLISGFPPPAFYSESPEGVGKTVSIATQVSNDNDVPIGADPEHCPHALNCFHDYETALAYAKKVNKPLLIDFTGWACVNCRKMEENVWSDPRVLDVLRNKIVLVSLYVDDKRELPIDQQTEVEIGGRIKKVKTIGNKWSVMQAQRYGTNSQPYYVLVDHQENTLNQPIGYEPDINAYLQWLLEGIETFEKSNKQIRSNQ